MPSVATGKVRRGWIVEGGEALRAKAHASRGDRRLSRPVLDSWFLLASVPADGSHIHSRDLAHELGMTEALALKHLRTLAAIGLLERHPERNLFRFAQGSPSDEAPARA